mgnify:CR=1 FL=1
MSLIVATSRLDENTLPQASERPSNFKNFFRSPIEIEADSEIAVQSVKIQRTGNITVEGDDFFCHYFGIDPDDLGGYPELTSLSRTIKPPKGTYTLSGFEKVIQDTLNKQYDDPRTFGGYLVNVHTNASGQELGFDIQCVDKGSAKGKDLHASMIAVPTYNIANPYSFWEDRLIEKSSKFTWTGGTGEFESTEDSTLLANSESIGILTGYPFGLNEGEFIIEVDKCDAAPFAIGLTRPQIQVESYRNASEAQTTTQRHNGIHDLDYYTKVREEHSLYMYNASGKEDDDLEGTYEYYDYVFMLDDDDEITIAQRAFHTDEEPFGGEAGPEHGVMQELDYWNNAYTGSPGTTKLTKAQWQASWDGIKFVGVGDEVELYFKQKGKAVFDVVVSSSFDNGRPGSAFSPIGSTSYALYPQLNIGKGKATITKMESSNTLNQYKYPVFTPGATGSYIAGDDAFSNEGFFRLNALDYIKIGKPICSDGVSIMTLHADRSEQKRIYPTQTAELLADGDYVYAGLNAAKGVDFVHLFTMNKFTQPSPLDTLINSQEFPNMSGLLGFVDRGFAISNSTEGYVAGDGGLTITFTSPNELQKTLLSSFIRVPNLTHTTFNGAQSGLSKILYQLPQFTPSGKQFGSLYFEANEKTYIKLNNTSPLILNMLQIQIVDSQEREINSLTGDTQIVFHVRKHKCD